MTEIYWDPITNDSVSLSYVTHQQKLISAEFICDNCYWQFASFSPTFSLSFNKVIPFQFMKYIGTITYPLLTNLHIKDFKII